MNDWIALSPDECKDGVGNLLVRHRAGVVGVLKEWDAATDRCVVALGDRQTMSAHRLYWTVRQLSSFAHDPLRAVLELLEHVDRKADIIMSTTNDLAANETALEQAFSQLASDLTTGLTDLHAQIAGLQADPTVTQNVSDRISALIQQVQQVDATIKSADPGPQPGLAEPAGAEPVALPDETVTPLAPETPESPAPAGDGEVADPNGPEVNVDPLAPVDTSAPTADPNEQVSPGVPVADPESPTSDPSV